MRETKVFSKLKFKFKEVWQVVVSENILSITSAKEWTMELLIYYRQPKLITYQLDC